MSLRRFAEGSPSIRRDLLKVVLLCCIVEKVFCRTVLWPTSSFFTTADKNATWTTTPSPTMAETTTTTTTGISTNTTIKITTIVKTTSTTKPGGTSSSTVFHAESTPFTKTPSSTTTVKISTTDSTDQPRITGEAEPTAENNVRAARKKQDKTKAVPSYVIPVVFSLLVVMAGVIMLIHYHRKRRRNNKIKIEDPGRLSVIYSTVAMKQEIIGNNNLLNTGDITIGNKPTLNRDCQGGGPNTYEEVKDTQNPLYNLSTCLSFNIYEELVDVSNGANTERIQNKNRRKNNPAYESIEIRNPRRKENPAYESVDGVFK